MDINVLIAQRIAARAADAAARIAEDPSTIILRRGNASLPPQTVRVEPDNSASRNADVGADNLAVTRRGIVIFGTPSFNVQVGDRLGIWGSSFRVDSVIPQQGEIQARAIRFE